MAKTTRKNLKLYGTSGSTTDFGQFGSQKAGAPLKTKDIETIQNLTAWVSGLTSAVVSGNKVPYLEDVNSLFLVLFYQLFYLLENGIPEWNADTTYYIGSMVRKAGTSEIYTSLVDNNLNNALPSVSDSNWFYVIGVSGGKTIIKNDLTVDANLNVTGTISGERNIVFKTNGMSETKTSTGTYSFPSDTGIITINNLKTGRVRITASCYVYLSGRESIYNGFQRLNILFNLYCDKGGGSTVSIGSFRVNADANTLRYSIREDFCTINHIITGLPEGDNTFTFTYQMTQPNGDQPHCEIYNLEIMVEEI